MSKTLFFFCWALASAGLAIAQETTYQATVYCEADDAGRVLNQVEAKGWLTLFPDGAYKLQFHIGDEGTHRLVKANAQQPQDMIQFQSKNGFQFFAYPQKDFIAVWLYKTPAGTHMWVHATPTGKAPPPAGAASGELVREGRFASVALYGTTSAPAYYHYDPATGRFSHDQKGLILRPDGTYYLKAEFGGMLMEEQGAYRIDGDRLSMRFSDGSVMVLTVVEGGRKLHYYSSGMLICEYFFLGTAR